MYQPSKEILDKYADVLVNFALNNGKGIKKGEVVFLQVPESAKPLLMSLQQTVIKAGAHAIIQYLPDGMQKNFYNLASDEQVKFFPAKFIKGKVDQADHVLSIIAETNLHELEGIDPKRIMDKKKAEKPYMDWRNAKEAKHKFSWTVGMYGTMAMAAEAGLSLKQCWAQIIKACYLDESNPIAKWQDAQVEIERVRKQLDLLKIEKLRVQAEGTDLVVGIGSDRRWVGGGGCNIPSFEIFTSPDWRQTEGFITFNQPLYRYGNLIKDIYLKFKAGKVVKATASKGEKVLREMIAVEGADKVGEFSMTDRRVSRINKFMAETLFDENFGGKYGNCHLALGLGFEEAVIGKKKNGLNDSAIHTDIILTKNRIITAFWENGKQKVIYKNGVFTI